MWRSCKPLGELPRWDGRLAEETKVHVVKEEGLKSIVDKVPRRVSVAESPDFFLHIQYPIEGFLLIQPSLGDRIIPLAISYKKHHCWQVLRHSNRNEEVPLLLMPHMCSDALLQR